MVNRATTGPLILGQQSNGPTGLGKGEDTAQRPRPPKIHPNAPHPSRTWEREMENEGRCQREHPTQLIEQDYDAIYCQVFGIYSKAIIEYHYSYRTVL